jgi:hypothetical protein
MSWASIFVMYVLCMARIAPCTQWNAQKPELRWACQIVNNRFVVVPLSTKARRASCDLGPQLWYVSRHRVSLVSRWYPRSAYSISARTSPLVRLYLCGHRFTLVTREPIASTVTAQVLGLHQSASCGDIPHWYQLLHVSSVR